MLGEVTNLGTGAELPLPFLEGSLTCQILDQGGFSSPVGDKDTDSLYSCRACNT